MAQYGLGRGLDALIARKKTAGSLPSAPLPVSPSDRQEAVLEVSIEQIETNDYQPRQQFDTDQLNELAESIKAYGIIQPLVASRMGDRYRLIAGERRLRAAKQVGLTAVPVILRDANEHERLAVALIENIQRVDLNPIELAFSYRRLLEEFNLTQDQVADKVGKSRPVVTNTLRMLNLPEEIQSALKNGKITYTVGRTILSIPDPDEQLAFFRDIIDQKVNTSQLTRMARDISKKPHTTRFNTTPDLAHKEAILREHFGTRVSIQKGKRGGSLTIDFYSDEELSAIVHKIINS